jgi:hypothetical protein
MPFQQVLTTSYLGKPEPTMTINFSRNSAHVAASYYNVSTCLSVCLPPVNSADTWHTYF